jgi:DNA-binding transcriptional MerR regulator
MNIGEAAAATGLSAKMIRHYEALGLVPKPARSDAGYRRFTEKDLHVLHFIARARHLGFSIREIVDLLDLWHDLRRPSRKVRSLTLRHIERGSRVRTPRGGSVDERDP